MKHDLRATVLRKMSRKVLVSLSLAFVIILFMSGSVYADMTRGSSNPAKALTADDSHWTEAPIYGWINEDIMFTLTRDGTYTVTGSGAIPDMEGYSYLSYAFTMERLMLYRYGFSLDGGAPEENAYDFFNYLGSPDLQIYGYTIKRIIIGEGITRIGDYFFRGTDVESVTVPSSVTSIGTGAFGNCYLLSEINASDEIKDAIKESIKVDEYSEEDDYDWNAAVEPASGSDKNGIEWSLDENGVLTISGTGAMYDYVGGTEYGSVASSDVNTPWGKIPIGDEYGYPPAAPWSSRWADIREIVITEGVTRIGEYAFNEMRHLKKVTIADSVTEIGSYAFEKCEMLEEVDIKTTSNLTTIENKVFMGCPIQEFYFPETLTVIGAEAFWNCTKLSELDLPQGLKVIGAYAFLGCRQFTEVEIPASVEEIGQCAFFQTGKIERFVIPDNSDLKMIGAFCFADNPVTSIHIPDTVNSIGEGAFYNCGNLTSLNIPAGVTELPDGVFCGCESLGQLTLPSGLTTIGQYAMYDCRSLTEIHLPSSLKTIGKATFGFCTGITEMTLPDNLTIIPEYAFFGCYRLQIVTAKTAPLVVDAYAFEICDALTSFTADAGEISCIGEYAFGGEQNLSELPIGKSTDWIERYGFAGCKKLHSLELYNSCQIGERAFLDCEALTEVSYSENPESIKLYMNKYAYGHYEDEPIYGEHWLISENWIRYGLIGEAAFSGSGLNSLTLCSGIGLCGYAFSGCDKLTSLTIPAGVVNFMSDGDRSDTKMFNDSGIKTMKFGEGVELIPRECFSGCSSLTSVVMADSISIIYNEAFKDCTSLKNVVFPDALTTICENAFESCKSLKSLSFPSNLQEIQASAFLNCSGIETVSMPVVDHTIGLSAFSGCTSLKELYFFQGVPSVEGDSGKSGDSFYDVKASAYYPRAWTTTPTTIYSGSNITWEQIGNILLKSVRCSGMTDYSVGNNHHYFRMDVPEGTEKASITSVKVAEGATYQLYSDSSHTKLTDGQNVELKEGPNDIYAVVTLGDEVEYDTIDIHRPMEPHPEKDRNSILYSVFNSTSTVYEPTLALKLMKAADKAYSTKQGIRNYLENDGIDHVQTYNYYTDPNNSNYGPDTVGYSVGYNDINGVRYVTIVIRGTFGPISSMSRDWKDDLNIGAKETWGLPGWHNSFEKASKEIYDKLDNLGLLKTSGTKYIITGHSRGAGVGNLLAVRLHNKGISKYDVYDYNFACPDTAKQWPTDWNWNNEHNNMFNIGYCGDIVTKIPGVAMNNATLLAGLAWGKYGQSVWYADDWDFFSKDFWNVTDHEPSNYIRFLSKKKPFSYYKSWAEMNLKSIGNGLTGKIVFFNCPVDIEAMDGEGNILTSVVNGELQYSDADDGRVLAFTDGEAKAFFVPEGQSISFRITGTDDGTMEYKVHKVDQVNDTDEELVAYINIEISKDKQFMAQPTDSGDFLVTIDEDQKVIGVVNTDGSETGIDLAKAKVTVSNCTYNGKQQKPKVNVSFAGMGINATNYTVTYGENVKAGKGTVTVKGIGNSTGSITKSFTIYKAANPLNIKGKTVKLKAKTLKKKGQTVKRAKAITFIRKGQGTMNYKLVSVTKAKFKKYFKINAKNGNMTVKKGLKKGTYKVKVKVKAAGTANYKAGSRIVTLTVKVK